MSTSGRGGPEADKPRKLIFIDLETIASANRLEGKDAESFDRNTRFAYQREDKSNIDNMIEAKKPQQDDFVLLTHKIGLGIGNSVCPNGPRVVRQLWKLHQLGYTLVSGSSTKIEEQTSILAALKRQAETYNQKQNLDASKKDYLQVPPFSAMVSEQEPKSLKVDTPVNQKKRKDGAVILSYERSRDGHAITDKRKLRGHLSSFFKVRPSKEHIVIDKTIYVGVAAQKEGYTSYLAATADDVSAAARPLTDILETIIAQSHTSEIKAEEKTEAAPVLTKEEIEANECVENELDQREALLMPENSPSDHLPRKVGNIITYNIMNQYGVHDNGTSGFVTPDEKTGAPSEETHDEYVTRLMNKVAPLIGRMAENNPDVDFFFLQEAPEVSSTNPLGSNFLLKVREILGPEWHVKTQENQPLSKCIFYKKTKYTVEEKATAALNNELFQLGNDLGHPKDVFPVVIHPVDKPNQKTALFNVHLDPRPNGTQYYIDQITELDNAAQHSGCPESRIVGNLNHVVGTNGPLQANISSVTTFNLDGAVGEMTYSLGLDGGVICVNGFKRREPDVLLHPQSGKELTDARVEAKVDAEALLIAKIKHPSYQEQQGLADQYLGPNHQTTLSAIQSLMEAQERPLSDVTLLSCSRASGPTIDQLENAKPKNPLVLVKMGDQFILYEENNFRWSGTRLRLTTKECNELNSLFSESGGKKNQLEKYEMSSSFLKILKRVHRCQPSVRLALNQCNAHRLEIRASTPIFCYEKLIADKTQGLSSQWRPEGFYYYMDLQGPKPVPDRLYLSAPQPVSLGYISELRILRSYLDQCEQLIPKHEHQLRELTLENGRYQQQLTDLENAFMRSNLQGTPDHKLQLKDKFIEFIKAKDSSGINNLGLSESELTQFRTAWNKTCKELSNSKAYRALSAELKRTNRLQNEFTHDLENAKLVQKYMQDKIADFNHKITTEFSNIKTTCGEYDAHLNGFFTKKNRFFKYNLLSKKQSLAKQMFTKLNTLSVDSTLNDAVRIEQFYDAFKDQHLDQLAISRDKKTAVWGKRILSALIITLGATLVCAPLSYYGVKRIWRIEGAEKTKQIDTSLQKVLGKTMPKT